MAQINLTFNTTGKQDVKLGKVLKAVNAERTKQELPPFTAIEDYFSAVLQDAVKGWVAQQTAIDAATIGAAYEAADDQVREKVARELGL